jgi:hypothetical protein
MLRNILFQKGIGLVKDVTLGLIAVLFIIQIVIFIIQVIKQSWLFWDGLLG